MEVWEDYFPLQLGDIRVPCQFSNVYDQWKKRCGCLFGFYCGILLGEILFGQGFSWRDP